jgi:hypothetical protein
MIDQRQQAKYDEQLAIREERRRKNLEILQKEITGKEIIIKTNTHFNRKERRYLVQEIRDEFVKTGGRVIRGVRLVNNNYPKEEQPLIKYPTELITYTKEGDKNKLTLCYTSDVNIERDFRRLHRSTRPDLEIYIYY